MSDPSFPSSPDEPQSLSGSHSSESVAPAPDPPTTNLDADITDELTDHLSLAARDLQLAGHAPDEAHNLAQQKFGDVAAIRRRLWWIQKGDEVMLRTALALVCAVLIVAVAALGLGNWRMSRTIDDLHGTLADLSENQKKITDAQKSILEAQQVNRTLTIQGHLYVGDPSMPAAGAEVHLYRVSDRKLIDKYTTHSDGGFTTAPLAPDRYFVVAPLIGRNPLVQRSQSATSSRFSSIRASENRSDSGPAFAVQTPPITLSQENSSPQVGLDVGMIPVGQVSFDLSAPIPSLTIRGGRGSSRDAHQALVSKLQEQGVKLPDILRSKLQIVMLKEGPALPVLATRQPELADWPLTRGLYHGDLGNSYARISEPWSREGREREREMSEEMAKLGRPSVTTTGNLLLYRRFEGSFPRFEVCEGGQYQIGAYLRLAGYDRVLERMAANRSPTSQIRERTPTTDYATWLPKNELKSIEVQDGKRTHLRLTSSADIQADTLAALESASTQEEVDALLERIWPVNVEELGLEDMILPKTDK